MTDWSSFYDDTRADWNARPPTSARTSVDISRRTEFFNHYIGPGSPNFVNRPHADCLKQVRDWQLQHQNQGWKDIGYNALICGHARCIEGRGLGYSGSHCPDHNTSGFGVQFMVAGTEKPTDAMYARMRRLYDGLVKAKGGALAKRGHRDGVSTTCPGDIVYAWVKAGMPAPTTQEDSMSAAEVAELKDYIGKVLVSGYTADGKTFPGMAKVDIENQSRITKGFADVQLQLAGVSAALEALATAQGVNPEEVVATVDKAVRDRLDRISFDVEDTPTTTPGA